MSGELMVSLVKIEREVYLMILDLRDVSQIAAMKKLDHFWHHATSRDYTKIYVKGRDIVIS